MPVADVAEGGEAAGVVRPGEGGGPRSAGVVGGGRHRGLDGRRAVMAVAAQRPHPSDPIAWIRARVVVAAVAGVALRSQGPRAGHRRPRCRRLVAVRAAVARTAGRDAGAGVGLADVVGPADVEGPADVGEAVGADEPRVVRHGRADQRSAGHDHAAEGDGYSPSLPSTASFPLLKNRKKKKKK